MLKETRDAQADSNAQALRPLKCLALLKRPRHSSSS